MGREFEAGRVGKRPYVGGGLRLEVRALPAPPAGPLGFLHNLGLARESWVFTVRLCLPEE